MRALDRGQSWLARNHFTAHRPAEKLELCSSHRRVPPPVSPFKETTSVRSGIPNSPRERPRSSMRPRRSICKPKKKKSQSQPPSPFGPKKHHSLSNRCVIAQFRHPSLRPTAIESSSLRGLRKSRTPVMGLTVVAAILTRVLVKGGCERAIGSEGARFDGLDSSQNGASRLYEWMT